MALAAEAQDQRGTSSGFSWTYWMACRILSVSSTFLPKARLLIVACWMMPCAQKSCFQMPEMSQHLFSCCAAASLQAFQLITNLLFRLQHDVGITAH